MPYDPKHHHRRTIRWRGYDYASRGLYFVTICTQNRLPFLSKIENRQAVLTAPGVIVRTTWSAIPERFPLVDLGPFVIMPNHIHAILANVDSTHKGDPRESEKEGAASSAPTLATIIRAFKSLSAIGINRQRGTPGRQVWQRNYYEHVIRDGREWGIACRYIWENPSRWEFDHDNPATSDAPDTNLPWESNP